MPALHQEHSDDDEKKIGEIEKHMAIPSTHAYYHLVCRFLYYLVSIIYIKQYQIEDGTKKTSSHLSLNYLDTLTASSTCEEKMQNSRLCHDVHGPRGELARPTDGPRGPLAFFGPGLISFRP